MTLNTVNFLLPWLLLVTWSPAQSSPPEVQVGNTTFIGTDTQVDSTTVWKFLGVRFGQPPTGSLRFQKPVPEELPSDTVNATYYRAACLPVIDFINAETEDEDCLFLNIFVPKNTGSGTNLPVMVWIYGGGFCGGNANAFDATILAAKGDVIVVTFNYRLGPFGFLSTGDEASVGNYGLWDQQLAIKWVKDNIRHFGGDDTRITLFGESAGGASVSYHTISPHSAGLFHRAIPQSGNYLSVWAKVWGNPLEHAKTLARNLSCDVEDTQTMVECLRGKSAAAIVTASRALWSDNVMKNLIDYRWMPVDDGDFVPPEERISQFPGEILLGVNNNEGAYFIAEVVRVANVYPQLWTEIYTRDFFRNRFLPSMIQMTFQDLVPDLEAQTVKDAVRLLECTYNQPQSGNASVAQEVLDEIYGDQEFYVGNAQYLMRENLASKTYLYVFDHYPDAEGGERGVSHAADLPFTFGFTGELGTIFGFPANENVTDKDRKMSVDFRTVLTNFAKTGDPHRPVSLPSGWPTFPPYTKGQQSYYALSLSSRVASRFREDKMAAWLTGVPALLKSEQVDIREWNECLGRPTSGARKNNDGMIVLFVSGFALVFFLM